MVEAQESRIWSIRAGYKNPNFYYLNEDGALIGIAIELIDLVCMEAGINCRVVRAPPSHCWQSNKGDRQSGGVGLMGNRFDACMFIHSLEREQIFQFSLPMFKPPDGFLYVLKGQSLDPDKLQGKKIGFIEAALTNELCLVKHSKDFVVNPNSIKHYKVTYLFEAIDDMKSGELDAIFSLNTFWTAAEREQLIQISRTYACYQGGRAMMSRKDSAFTANWNVGLTKLKNTDKFAKFCEEANARHSRNVICLT